MAATRTSKQLAHRVASAMNFLRPGEPLDAELEAEAITTWVEVHASLRDKGIAYWAVDEIPLEVFRTVVWLIAVEVAPGYGALPIVLNALSQPNAKAATGQLEQELRDHVAKTETTETLKLETY